MSYVREDIHGTTPQDTMKTNNNFEQLWQKVFGDLNFADASSELKTRICTQWVPAQGEGNLDSTYPLYIRFYVPPNTKTIKSAQFNFMADRYRMDSSITSTKETQSVTSSTTDQTTYSSSSTSTASTTVSIGVNNNNTESSTFPVEHWGVVNTIPAPNKLIDDADVIDPYGMYWKTQSAWDANYNPSGAFGAGFTTSYLSGYPELFPDTINQTFVDLYCLNHKHRVVFPPHTHPTAQSPHNHSVTVAITIPGHFHTVIIPSHSHDLLEGIKVGSNVPSNVKFYVNDNLVATLNGDNAVQNNVEVKNFLNIGAWNIIKVTCNSTARATVYGVLELVQNFF